MFILLLLPLKYQFYVKDAFMKQAAREAGTFFLYFLYPLYLSKMPPFLGNERFIDIFPILKQPGELACKINKPNCLEILDNKTQDSG